jgi:hypothetical protein
MTRLVIEDMDGKPELPLSVAFEDRIVISKGYDFSFHEFFWIKNRCALVDREQMMTSFLDPLQVAERALGGPVAQWHLRDEP